MTVTQFVPGGSTAYVTDAVLALSLRPGVDTAVMALCADADNWRSLTIGAVDHGLAAVVMHEADRLRVAVIAPATVIVDTPHGERRFVGTETWTSDVVDTPQAMTIRSTATAADDHERDGEAGDPAGTYCTEGGAVPASMVSRRLVAPTAPTADPFEMLFGHTVARSVEAAAVRADDPQRRGGAALGVLVFATGQRVVVDAPVVIGRNPHADDDPGGHEGPRPRLVKVAHPGVSRRHAAIRLDRRSAFIDDLGSTNGTIVTLQGRQAVALRPGTPIELAIGAVVDLGGGVSFTMEEAA